MSKGLMMNSHTSSTVFAASAPSRVFIFDLDGTLIDSVPDLMAALNRLMITRGLPLFTTDDVRSMVGDGAPALIEKAFLAHDAVPDHAALSDFLTDYTAHAAVRTRPFPDVEATLTRLSAQGWRLAVCTNKPSAAARAVLEALGLAHHFVAMVGGDSTPYRKPDPRLVLAALQEAQGQADHAIMVGDHRNDVQAAKGAGIPCVFAGWGYGTTEMAQDAVAIAPRFADLPELGEKLLTGK